MVYPNQFHRAEVGCESAVICRSGVGNSLADGTLNCIFGDVLVDLGITVAQQLINLVSVKKGEVET